jgi:hypothetical protein
MATSRSDMNVLSTDPGFQNRVRASLISASISITTESRTTAFHRERETYAVAILNSPDSFKLLFANSVATDASVISDATQVGTVVLTSGNVATQAALITDAHIDNAIAGQFNSFFRTPAN